MKFRALSVCILLVGMWFAFIYSGQEESVPSMASLQSLSLAHSSKGLRWQLLWNCEEQMPCPRLSDYPDLTVSQTWLDVVSQELAALPKHTGLPKHTEREERLDSVPPSHALTDYTLTMHGQSGQTRRFRIGQQNPLLRAYYLFELPMEEARTESDGGQRAQFYLLSENLYQHLTAEQEEILERRLFPDFPSSELINMCVVMPVGKPPIHLQQQDGVWTINDKVADSPFVHGLFKSISSLRFTGFVPPRDNFPLFVEIIIQYATPEGGRKTELLRIFREMGAEEDYYLQPGDTRTLFHLEALPRMMSHITEEMFLR